MQFISEYSALITLAGHIVFAVVYLAYFHSLISGLRSRRRSNIYIEKVRGAGGSEHLTIANMGKEPIYVTAIFVEAHDSGQKHWVKLADENLSLEDRAARVAEVDEQLSWTQYGPLDVAQCRSVGRLDEIASHVLQDSRSPFGNTIPAHLTVTVVAESSHDVYLAAAKQTFAVSCENQARCYVPLRSGAAQLKGWFARRRIHQWLKDALRDEAEQFGALADMVRPDVV